MSTNGIWKSRFENHEGYGDTLWTVATVTVVDGKVYLDGISADQYIRSFEGKVIGLEVVAGLSAFDDYYQPVDEKIAPLVTALQKRGIRTLHSCEGHMEPRDKYSYRCPQVDMPATDAVKLILPNAFDWYFMPAPWGDQDVVRLRPRRDAENADELKRMQDEARRLADSWI